jgi:hypothetical protein
MFYFLNLHNIIVLRHGFNCKQEMVLLYVVNRKMWKWFGSRMVGNLNQANITLNTSADFVLLPASAIYFKVEGNI